MKILVICQYYYPEPFRVTDICEELVKRGHEVTVVTGTPNYPMGEIYPGYEDGKKSDEVINGVLVHRCPIAGRKTGVLHRFINYYDYVFKSTKYVNTLDGSYDVVFVNQLSPVMMSNAGIKYKKRFKKKLILYCLDLWPESLVAGGIKRNSVIYKFYHVVSKRIYKKADEILGTSKSFSDYFKKEFGIENAKYLPQYAEDLFSPEECKKKPDEYLDLMFAGNIGKAQGVETIIEAARLTQNEKEIRWHIVGDGSELESLKARAKGLDNVFFYGRKPLDEMPKYYSMADVMLVTLVDDLALSLTLPGKVQTYMAAGKPIIAAANGEICNVISSSEAGLCCRSGDVFGFVKIIKCFIENENRADMGVKARDYYLNNFSVEIVMDKLENILLNNCS